MVPPATALGWTEPAATPSRVDGAPGDHFRVDGARGEPMEDGGRRRGRRRRKRRRRRRRSALKKKTSSIDGEGKLH